MSDSRQDIVLDTVKLVAAAFRGEMTTDQFNDKICEAGMHRELFALADPIGDDLEAEAYGVATDEFDGELYDAIETVLMSV